MLAGDNNSPPDHVAKRIRNYLGTYHAQHPEEGCVLAALGPEIARTSPQAKAQVESERTRQEILASSPRFVGKVQQPEQK